VAIAASLQDLRSAIATAHRNAAPVRGLSEVSRAGAGPGRVSGEPTRLTRREREVLERIEKGLSTKEIAAELGIRVNTVRTHVQRLMPKVGALSRLQAAALANGQLSGAHGDPGVQR
jgi:DNA-binding NarL/FixJ family response regulator